MDTETLIRRIAAAISAGLSAEEIAAHFEAAGTSEEVYLAYVAAKILTGSAS